MTRKPWDTNTATNEANYPYVPSRDAAIERHTYGRQYCADRTCSRIASHTGEHHRPAYMLPIPTDAELVAAHQGTECSCSSWETRTHTDGATFTASAATHEAYMQDITYRAKRSAFECPRWGDGHEGCTEDECYLDLAPDGMYS